MPLVWVVAAYRLAPVFSQFDGGSRFDCPDVLYTGEEFFVNHYSSSFMFYLVDHWRMIRDKEAEAEAAEYQAIEEEARRATAARCKAAHPSLVQAQAAGDSAHIEKHSMY